MHAQRDIVMANLSVCPSVRPTTVYCVKTNEHIVTLFDDLVGATPQIFCVLTSLQKSKGNPSAGTRGGKILQFSTEITVYFGNDRRQTHGYYGSLTGSHR